MHLCSKRCAHFSLLLPFEDHAEGLMVGSPTGPDLGAGFLMAAVEQRALNQQCRPAFSKPPARQEMQLSANINQSH